MAINVYGVTGDVDDVEWARLFADAASAGAAKMLVTGMVCTPGASALTSSVATGRSYQVGTGLVPDAVTTVTHAANSGSNDRLDTICAQVDWSGTETTAGSIVVVPGVPSASPRLTPLTQVEGTKWQTPLFSVRVAAGKTTGTFGASAYTDLRPGSASVALNFSSNWTTNSNYPLTLRKSGGLIRLAGRTARANSTLGAGDVTTFNIPAGFWPADIASGFCSTGGDAFTGIASMGWHRLEVATDGSASFRAGSDITAGTNVHIDMTWIGA